MFQPKEIKSAVSEGPLPKRALSAHSAVGIAIAAVLYVITFSGIVSVLKDELYLWEQRGEPQMDQLQPEAAQASALNGFAKDPETKHLFIHMPTEENPRAIVETDNEETHVDQAGELSVDVHHPWTDFIIDLHYYLHLPKSFGMTVVAIFGVFLFGMSISGLLAHPNIFKDAFAFRRSKSEQIKNVDLHNRLSVWTAPFHISNSLSGAMIGLATLSALAVGTLKYEGDFGAVFEPVFGAEPTPDDTKAPMANIEKALLYMEQNHPDKPVIYVILHDPGTVGQYLQIMAEHPRRLIYAEKYNFNGAGEFIDTVGSADGYIGQQVADSVYKVHFGAFGGMPVKLAFIGFGISLLYIIAAGMKIYFIKRRTKGQASVKLEGAWRGVLIGVPLLLLVTAVQAVLMPASTAGLGTVFWVGCGVTVVGTMVLFQLREKRQP